jgi:hypothetical protein
MNIAGSCRGMIVMIGTTDAAGIDVVAVLMPPSPGAAVDSSHLRIMREESQTHRRRSMDIFSIIAIAGMSFFFIL